MTHQQRSIVQMDAVANLPRRDVNVAEIESALASHPQVSEVVVVPMSFEAGREALSAFVTLKEGFAESEVLRVELMNSVRERIGPNAVPEKIHFAPSLPKSRSGKIMRDVLEEISES